jgi:hypothetical protein
MRLSGIGGGLSIFALVILSPLTAEGFPELVKHGYPNCAACHISPSGGGVLTEYGRALSKELLSTWGRENEERFFYFVPTTETLAFGGDYRGVRVQDKTSTATRDRWITMQRDLEAALSGKGITADATIGVQEPRLNGETEFISRRHYLIYQVNEELSLRAGRFYPAFGLYIPDHNTVIRRGLGWDQNMETYNLEGAWQNEKWNHFATAIFGRPDDNSLNRERGASYSLAYNPSEKLKIGGSYYYAENDSIVRHYSGPYAILGFSKKLFLLTQFNVLRNFPYTSNKALWGLTTYNRLDFEFYKGIHLYLGQELMQTDLETGLTRSDTVSAGLQFFPRPHFEFQAVFQKQYLGGFSGTPTDRIILLSHFYP